jgi:hypothetical protein
MVDSNPESEDNKENVDLKEEEIAGKFLKEEEFTGKFLKYYETCTRWRRETGNFEIIRKKKRRKLTKL